MKNTILIIAAIVLVVMNIAAYVLMGVDKKRAKAGAWRIPEKTLFLVTGLFGGPPGLPGDAGGAGDPAGGRRGLAAVMTKTGVASDTPGQPLFLCG